METALCPQNRLPMFVRLFTLAALLFLGLLSVGKLNGAEQDAFRSDVLTFHGNQKVSTEALTNNSFLVTLTCKTATPTQTPPEYSIILRNVDAVEKALLHDAQQGKWDKFDLLRASLIAEGIRSPELINTYDARLNALVAKVVAAARAEGNTSQQALTRSLFEAMHKEILTRPYDIDCTALSKVMQTGHFNCVSATVLFNCLAEKAGLDVCALEMPGHALTRARFADGSTMDIETTAATWFELRSDKERQLATQERIVAPAPAPAHTNPVTAQNAAPLSAMSANVELSVDNRREINPVQLVATIYYNIGVDLHAKQRYPEAVAANLKVLYLDRNNKQAWTNLLASLNNWALGLADAKMREYGIASIVLDQGVALDPTYAEFRSNQAYIFYFWIRGLAEAGCFDDAWKIYAKAQERVPNNEKLQKLMNDIKQIEDTLVQQGQHPTKR